LLHEMVRMSSELNYMVAELDEVCLKYKRLESSLQTYVEREKENGNKHLSQIQSLQKKLEETEQRRDPSREANKSMTQESLVTLDKLSLPLDALWKGKEKLTSLGEGSKGPNASNLDEAVYSESQSNPTTVEDATVLEQGATLESVVQKLEVANKERDKALANLEALRKCLRMRNYFPKTEDKLSWFGWVHRLSDRGYMVSTAMRAFRETAAMSVE
jgi:predicted nuclease with TOPRIM domain